MKDRVAQLEKVLIENGFRLTKARHAIVAALIASGAHVTADELVKLVHRSDPGVGRMTVYRTLDLLSGLGLIRPIYQGSGAAHYILLIEGHHHHLVCSHCDSVIEFESCAIRDIERTVSLNHQFEIQGHLLEIYGRCLECRSGS